MKGLTSDESPEKWWKRIIRYILVYKEEGGRGGGGEGGGEKREEEKEEEEEERPATHPRIWILIIYYEKYTEASSNKTGFWHSIYILSWS